MASPMTRHDRKFNKRSKGLGSGKISLFFLEFINSPIFLSPSSSHFKKFTYCLNHCCFSTCPGQASNIPCLYFVLSLSPPLRQRRTEHATKGFRDVLGFFPEEAKLKTCRFPGAHVQVVLAAAHCCAASAPSQQPAAGVSQPTPCPWRWAAPLCLRYGAGGQMIATSYSGLWAVWLRASNAVRLRTFKLSVVCRIKCRGELWCPWRHLSWWRLHWYCHTCRGTAVSRQVGIPVMHSIIRALLM